MPVEVQCPKLDFAFTGLCPHNECILWYKSGEDTCTGCLKLDRNVSTGIEHATSVNNKVLEKLAGSDDPQIQLEASKMLLHFGLLYSVNLVEYQLPSFELCKCGAKADTCSHNGACESRLKAGSWLLQLFMPLMALNSQATKRERLHVLWATMMQHHKNNRLPSLVEKLLPTLALSKRIV